jgi:hypothetical protein
MWHEEQLFQESIQETIQSWWMTQQHTYILLGYGKGGKRHHHLHNFTNFA